MRILRISLLASLVLAGACVVTPGPATNTGPRVESGPGPTRGVLEGVVVDSQTHEPLNMVALDFATLEHKPQPVGTAVTDSGGRFRTPELPPGRYAIRLRREKYDPVQASAEIQPGTNQQTFEMTRNRP